MERLKGIVLRTAKYGENGYVVDMFTDHRGRMSEAGPFVYRLGREIFIL